MLDVDSGEVFVVLLVLLSGLLRLVLWLVERDLLAPELWLVDRLVSSLPLDELGLVVLELAPSELVRLLLLLLLL